MSKGFQTDAEVGLADLARVWEIAGDGGVSRFVGKHLQQIPTLPDHLPHTPGDPTTHQPLPVSDPRESDASELREAAPVEPTGAIPELPPFTPVRWLVPVRYEYFGPRNTTVLQPGPPPGSASDPTSFYPLVDWVPIAPWNQLAPRFRSSEALLLTGKQPDLDEACELLSNLRPLDRLPRKQSPRWSRVVLILQRDDHLMPVFRDQERIQKKLGPALREKLTVIPFPTASMARTGAGRCQSPEELAGTIPAGSLVLTLGDLNSMFEEELLAAPWRELGRRLAAQHCRCLALVPSLSRAKTVRLHDTWSLLPWDVSEGGGNEDLDLLLACATLCVKLEPELLRILRLRLDLGGIETELSAWMHPLIRVRNIAGASLDPALAKEHRLRLNDHPRLRQRAWELLQGWRAHSPDLPPFYLMEEALYLPEQDWEHFPEGLLQQIKTIHASLHSELADAPCGWHARTVDRLPEWVFSGSFGETWSLAYSLNKDRVSRLPPGGYVPAGGKEDKSVERLWGVWQDVDQLRVRRWGVDEPHGSLLGLVRTGNDELLVEAVESFEPVESAPEFWDGPAPSWADAWGEDEYGLWSEFVVEGLRQRMRWIPAGTFWMGSPEDELERELLYPEDRHEVTLTEGFWMFDTAVRQDLWEAVMGKNPSNFKGARRPVEQVSWEDAKAFLAALAERVPGLELALPTDAQWEYACRAGTETPFSFGANITPEQVNYDGNFPYADGEEGLYRQKTVEVGSLPPNRWGLYEMHGNVWEWCEDWFTEHLGTQGVTNPTGPTEGSLRVFRGGSWVSTAWFVRSAMRDAGRPDGQAYDLGFRCLLVPGSQSGQPASQENKQGRRAERRRAAGPAVARAKAPGASGDRRLVDLGRVGVASGDGGDGDSLGLFRRGAGQEWRSSLERLSSEWRERPDWAVEMGRDRYGLWAVFEVAGVRQRVRWTPPGRFWMGDDRHHEVVLTEGFWMFDTACRQALYEAVVGTNPSEFKRSGDHPVENVSWDDAHAFCAAVERQSGVGLALPTEAQWEYACRAGTETRYWFGDDMDDAKVLYSGSRKERGTIPVASLDPNPFGLYQMHGNVWEWCMDWLANYPDDLQINPTGPKQGSSRVIRGGSWDDSARNVRSALRDAYWPDWQGNYLGFRCLLVPGSQPVKQAKKAEASGGGEGERARRDDEAKRTEAPERRRWQWRRKR